MNQQLTSIMHGGNLLNGTYAASSLFSAVSSLNQLEQYGLYRPTTNFSAKKRELAQDPLFNEAHKLRETVQRRFDKSRCDRAVDYSNYIESIYTGVRLGAVPPVTLYCPGKCDWIEDRNVLVLPYRSALVNIDGETQTEARFLLRDRLPESGDWTMRAELYHGITDQHASQILHDFNRYAHPIKESVVAALNSEGNLTKLIDRIAEVHEVPQNQINRFSRRPKIRSGEMTTYSTLISAVIGAVGGFDGIKRPAVEIGLLNNGKGETMLEAAVPFLSHVFTMLQQHPDLRLSDPSLIAILGAVSHQHHVFVTYEQWTAAQAAFKQKFGQGEAAALTKRQAILQALGINQ